MHFKKSGILIGLLVFGMAAGAYGFFWAENPSLQKSGSKPRTDDSAPIDKAAFAFEITDIRRDGNIVSFTIPENARALEKKADAVVLSGLYTGGRNKDDCPVVQSDAVSKSVEKYSPMSGKARVSANFEDEDMAKAAEASGCLLINDPS